MMKISIHVILEELLLRYKGPDEAALSQKFRWVTLFERNAQNLDRTLLHITLLSDYLEYIGEREVCHDVSFFCLQDRIIDEEEFVTEHPNVFIIEDYISLALLFNDVQRVFIKIQEWISALRESVMSEKGIQDLLDLSDNITLNHISVMDHTFRLMAHSRNIPCDDPVVVELIRLGYHPDEMIEKLTKYRHIAFYKTSNEILIDDSYRISNYIALEKAFMFNGTFTVEVVMNCNVKVPTKGLIELFQILIGFISHYIPDVNETDFGKEDYTFLLFDLLNERSTYERETIEKRANRINIPYRAFFSVFVVRMQDVENAPLERIRHRLSQSLWPNTKSVVYNDRIVLFNVYKTEDYEAQERKKLNSILPFLRSHQADCGISSVFTELHQLYYAYKQASFALDLKDMPGAEERDTDARIYHYETNIVTHMVQEYVKNHEPQIHLTSAYQFVESLYRDDKENGLGTLLLLKTYLQCDCNATETSRIRNTHRNNVIYHINKMRRAVGPQFDTHEFKMQLNIFLPLFCKD